MAIISEIGRGSRPDSVDSGENDTESDEGTRFYPQRKEISEPVDTESDLGRDKPIKRCENQVENMTRPKTLLRYALWLSLD